MSVLAIIPARGGSKRLPGKNLMRLGGQTLMERAIHSAYAAKVDRVVVTTDSANIAANAMWANVEVIDRPAHLATDEAGMIPTLRHAVVCLGGSYDLIVCLQPTSPFRTGEDIDETVRLVTGRYTSAQTVVRDDYYATMYYPNGSVYVVTRQELMAGRLITDHHRLHIIPWERSPNINTLWDFKIAEMILENR